MIKVEYKDNGKDHRDLIVWFNRKKFTCDTYYLVIGHNTSSRKKTVQKAKDEICKIIKEWITTLKKAGEGETVYLPFDFSDQFIRWFRCSITGDKIRIDEGWTANDFSPEKPSEKKFTVECKPVIVKYYKQLDELKVLLEKFS